MLFRSWYAFDDGYKGMARLLDKNRPISAVFCACDLMAVGAMKYTMSQGLKVPEDISFIGFDDVDVARMYNPALSTVKQPFEMKGKLSIETLIKMIEKKELHPININHVLTHQLVIRDSTLRK